MVYKDYLSGGAVIGRVEGSVLRLLFLALFIGEMSFELLALKSTTTSKKGVRAGNGSRIVSLYLL